MNYGILDQQQPQSDPSMAGILGLLGQQNLSEPMIAQIIRMLQQMQPIPVRRYPTMTTGIRG